MALALSAVVTNATCYGGSNGAINLTVTGGTPPYAYNWGVGITSQNATNIPADTYYPSVTDNQGCLIDTTIQVTSPPEILFGGADVTNATCFGKSDGIAMIHASGGVGTYT